MKFFRALLICLFIAGCFLYFQNKDQAAADGPSIFNDIYSYVETFKNKPEIAQLLGELEDGFQALTQKLKELDSNTNEKPEQEEVNNPDLETPAEQTFSIHNVEIGDTKEEVEKQVGAATRASSNEYGVQWHAYHQNYQNFFMAAYDDQGKVAGLYTNQDLISSKLGIKSNDSRQSIIEKLGEPIKGIQKGLVMYQVQNNGEYNIYELDNSYITVFFDKHENDTVTALQIISKDLEQQKQDFFADGNQALQEGFEYQLFDLTNAARVQNGLSPLSWDDHVKITARDHSADMAKNRYFSHDNLDGLSPFDRLKQDRITYQAAGENIASGQASSIFAHEGLMNSLGHRENILSTNFNALGVGVAFDSDSRPYYTENFLGK